jgi:hypothetical protein
VALCIVPPDEAWDTLQRARHAARDDSFLVWPPAIRLFHPVPSLMLDPLRVAYVVERYKIEPFEVRLNRWAVIPHGEAVAAMMQAESSSSSLSPHSFPSSPSHESSNRFLDGNDPEAIRQAQVDALIEREERLGRLNKIRRDNLAKTREQREVIDRALFREENDDDDDAPILANKRKESTGRHDGAEVEGNDDISNPEDDSSRSSLGSSSSRPSPREIRQEQKRMYEEFNGPCVVCLEPDDESKRRLVELRELLRKELFDNQPGFIDRYSPTSTVLGPSTHSVFYRSDQVQRSSISASSSSSSSLYRPLVPIGAFGTVNEAIRMARKLRRLWNPLTFEVTDLQVLSMTTSSSSDFPRDVAGVEWDGNDSPSASAAAAVAFSLSSRASSAPSSFSSSSERRSFVADPPQMGCDAMIMLVGQEVFIDDEEAREMTRLMCERGEPGGVDRRRLRPLDRPEEESEAKDLLQSSLRQKQRNPMSNALDVSGEEAGSDCEDLLQFLDEDDVDEGTVVVIGRTHFFTGEMRHYVGMPATSITEGQASIITTGSSGDTGAQRRKGATGTARLRDGEFGRVSSVNDGYNFDEEMDVNQ